MLGYTPVSAGFASLPVTGGVLVAAGTASQLVPRVGPKPLMVAGGVFAAAGLFTLSFLGLDTPFWQVALPGQVLLGLGLGFTFVPLSNLALVGVGEHDAGAASAVLQAVQQVGASIGTALLATFSVTAITNSLSERPPTPEDPTAPLVAQVEGYTTAFTWGAALLLVAAISSAVLIKAGKDDLPAEMAVHAG
ncbi:unannotated protein [freshwater metagenome]|uniref:Unannotated protein n=1 Tax=freshwater metagenome TaxID=449393 RepID=A0A6J7IVB5_9ZZZZ